MIIICLCLALMSPTFPFVALISKTYCFLSSFALWYALKIKYWSMLKLICLGDGKGYNYTELTKGNGCINILQNVKGYRSKEMENIYKTEWIAQKTDKLSEDVCFSYFYIRDEQWLRCLTANPEIPSSNYSQGQKVFSSPVSIQY